VLEVQQEMGLSRQTNLCVKNRHANMSSAFLNMISVIYACQLSCSSFVISLIFYNSISFNVKRTSLLP
jgi:hypothetical protein